MSASLHGPETSGAAAAHRIHSLGRGLDRAPAGSLPGDAGRIETEVRRHQEWVGQLRTAMNGIVVGRKRLVDRLIIALVAGGPLLLEGEPGLSKSTTIEALARATGLSSRTVRLDSTSTPNELVLPTTGGRRGALFSHIVLAEDIDEAPRRVQDALLDAAREQRLLPGNERLDLPDPFLLVAAQGTQCRAEASPLAERQLDRFFLKLRLEYPAAHEERQILDRSTETCSPRGTIIDADQLRGARALVKQIHVSEKMKDYIISLVEATRAPSHYGLDLDRYLHHGVSSRVTIDLERATRVVALLRGGAFAQVGDVQAVWADVVGHRLGLSTLAAEEGLKGHDVAEALLVSVPAP